MTPMHSSKFGSFITLRFTITSIILVLAGIALGAAAHTAEALTSPLYYTFNSDGILYEAPSADQSTSPYFWLASGAKLIIQNGIGETIQGSLPSSDPWHALYANTAAVSSDNGAHPQNTFLMFARSTVQNPTVQLYVNRVADNIANSQNRHPYNGESLLARYQNNENYYMASIRVDGLAVIKKKVGGTYQTLATKQLFPGTYSASADLIPHGKWIGLRLSVIDTSSGAPQLSLYTDIGKTGMWQKQLSVVDSGTVIKSPGLSGIESDYADAQFENFLLSDAPVSLDPAPSPTPAPPASAMDYDATVLADIPVMYLTMASPSSGKEVDQSGHTLSGTYKGGIPTLETLPNGQSAAHFNGSGQYLSVPSSAALSIPTTRKLTWEAWIRPDTFNFPSASGDGYVDWMGKCANYSPTCEWEGRLYGNSTPEGRADRFSAYVFNPSAGLGAAADWQPSSLLPEGVWYHVVAEYDMTSTPSACDPSYPGTINIWVNGVKQNFASHAPTGCMSQYDIKPVAGSSPLTIGTMALDTWFTGAVGKVAIYNYLLSQTQINSHYTNMTGKSPSGSCSATCTL